MIPDQLSYAVEDEGETHAEHDQGENDEYYHDMLRVDQPWFLLLQVNNKVGKLIYQLQSFLGFAWKQ